MKCTVYIVNEECMTKDTVKMECDIIFSMSAHRSPVQRWQWSLLSVEATYSWFCTYHDSKSRRWSRNWQHVSTVALLQSIACPVFLQKLLVRQKDIATKESLSNVVSMQG